MITLLKRYVKAINNLFERAGLNRAAEQLESLSDRQLEDMGVCREKLKHGAAAYPWKAQTDNIVRVGNFSKPLISAAQSNNQQAA